MCAHVTYTARPLGTPGTAIANAELYATRCLPVRSCTACATTASAPSAVLAPPPVPAHAHDRPPVHPLFVPSASDLAGPAAGGGEGELNLADLINIDEDPSGEVAMTPVDSLPTPFGEDAPTLSLPQPKTKLIGPSQPTPSPLTPVTPRPAGISPFEQSYKH